MATTPAFDFNDEIRPMFVSCGDMKTFRKEKVFRLTWTVDSSPIISGRTVDTYLFRIIGDINQRLEPSSWENMSPTSNVRWKFIAKVSSKIVNDGKYVFTYNDSLSDLNLSESNFNMLKRQILTCKRAIYYKVCTFVDKMSAGALPLFVYADGKNIIARATKNLVFNNNFYKDRQIVWKYENTRNNDRFARVFVDTSTVDFFNPSGINTKPPIVWITGEHGHVECLNFYTGQSLGSCRADIDTIFAGCVDPLNTVFWFVEPANNGNVLLRYVHYDGNVIPVTVKTYSKNSSWNTRKGMYQTPGMTCTVNAIENNGIKTNKTVLNLIFATEEVWRIAVSNNNGRISVEDPDKINRKRFGITSGIKGGQPNVLGITNATPRVAVDNIGNVTYYDSVWANGHVPQRHIGYKDFAVESKKYERVKFTDSSECFRKFNDYKSKFSSFVQPIKQGGTYDAHGIKSVLNALQGCLGEAAYNDISDAYKAIGRDLAELYDKANGKFFDDCDIGVAYKDMDPCYDLSKAVLNKAMNPPLGNFNKKEQAVRNGMIYDDGEGGWACAAGNGASHGFADSPWNGSMISGATSAKTTQANIHRYVRTKIYRVFGQIEEYAKNSTDTEDEKLAQIKKDIRALKKAIQKGDYADQSDVGKGLPKLVEKIDKLLDSSDNVGDCLERIATMKQLARSGTVVEFNRTNKDEIEALHQSFTSENRSRFTFNIVKTNILQDIGMLYGVGSQNGGAGTGPDERDNNYRSGVRHNTWGSGNTWQNLMPNEKLSSINLNDTASNTVGKLIADRVSRAQAHYQLFTNPTASNERWGWLGVTVLADQITCDNIPELSPNTNPNKMGNYKEYFTFNDSAASDRYVPRVLYKHTDGVNINSAGGKVKPTTQPDTSVYPRLSQFGITASILGGGWLKYRGQSSDTYIVYQADNVERSIHKLEFDISQGTFTQCTTATKGTTDLTLPITMSKFGSISDTDNGSRHVIMDDANSLWSITTMYVDRYYPSAANARLYGQNTEYYLSVTESDPIRAKNIKKALATYEVSEKTNSFKGLLGRHFGNLPAIEYALLRKERPNCSTRKEYLGFWYDHISDNSVSWRNGWNNVFDLSNISSTNYGSGGSFYFTPFGYDENGAWSEMSKTSRCRNIKTESDCKMYIDENEYNDDNLGIAPIKARGSLEALDIGRPFIGYPFGHVKVIDAEEVDKTIDCDNPKFGLSATRPSVFGRSGSFTYEGVRYNYDNRPKIKNEGGGVVYSGTKTQVTRSRSVSSPYNNWEYHLTAHGYDDLEVVERMVFQDLVGWEIKGFTFMVSGNVVGDPDPFISVVDKATTSGAEGIWFLKNNGTTLSDAVLGVDYTYDSTNKVFVVENDDVWCEVIKKVRPDILWVEPNVRGGLTEVGAATKPNYNPKNHGLGGNKIIKGRIDLELSPVYDLYRVGDTNAVNAEETNYFFIYERYPYPEFCFKGYTDDITVSGFWGVCEE